MEADFWRRRFWRRRRRVEILHNALEDIHDGSLVNIEAELEFPLQQGEFLGQLTAMLGKLSRRSN
jgi:hypothetical protein